MIFNRNKQKKMIQKHSVLTRSFVRIENNVLKTKIGSDSEKKASQQQQQQIVLIQMCFNHSDTVRYK